MHDFLGTRRNPYARTGFCKVALKSKKPKKIFWGYHVTCNLEIKRNDTCGKGAGRRNRTINVGGSNIIGFNDRFEKKHGKRGWQILMKS